MWVNYAPIINSWNLPSARYKTEPVIAIGDKRESPKENKQKSPKQRVYRDYKMSEREVSGSDDLLVLYDKFGHYKLHDVRSYNDQS
jgi:hypothetical protein